MKEKNKKNKNKDFTGEIDSILRSLETPKRIVKI